MKKINLAAIMAALIIGIGSLASANAAVRSNDATVGQRAYNTARISKQVRKKLVTLPYYGVFDNLAYRIDGGTVTLYGQVVRSSTKSDAGRSVARVEGVSRVVNNIEVLPLSSFDDSLRVRTLRALQRAGGLHRYFMGANPSLHIVVNRGHVTLAGVVSSNFDRQLAYMTARQVSGSFSVSNQLRLESEDDGIGR
ncbi:MAG TPA: BON domain-containing protein [Pyrinomonadaceae bacterium]|nr:BON domain-containing protein [Pyrinomonadaceae bacterium]